MANPKIRLHIFSNNRPQPNRRVYLERKQGVNEPLIKVASLISDHTGYVSFSLARSRRRLHDGQPDLDTIPLSALSVRVEGDATLETPLNSLFGLPQDATVKDIGCRRAELAIQPQQGAASNDNSEVAEGGCFVRPNGLSIEDPDLCDYEVSPASLVDHRLVRLGEDCCDRPTPASGTVSETDIWRVVAYDETDTPQDIPSAEALVNPADKPIEQTGLRWGLLERYRQTWTHLGHSLGEIVYSLALAPGESTQLAVIEWSREDLGRRDDSITSSERLEHEQRTDRGIEETTKAALREDQGGGSFQAGAAASIPIKAVQLNVGVGGGVTHSWGKRDLSGKATQDLHQRVMQESQLQRQQNSTVIVQGRAREDNRLAVRAVANHNHCHALTIQYFEVLRHLALTTRFVERESAVLVPHAVLDFDLTAVLRWRHLLGPAALDAAVANSFAALERSVTGRQAPQASKGEKPPAAGTGSGTPAGGIGKLKSLRISISSSPTQSRLIESSRGGIGIEWEGLNGGFRFLKVHKAGMATAALTFPVSTPAFTLDADLAEAGVVDVSPSELKSIRIAWNNDDRKDWGAWAVQRIRVEGNDGISFQTLLDKQELVYFEAGPQGAMHKDITFGAAPVKTDPTVRPGVETIDDKIAIENLITHISGNAVHYSRAVWLGLDDGARRMLIAKQFGQSVASSIDGLPLAISGNHVAFRWRGKMEQWFTNMIDRFNTEPLSPETSIVFLPTRGLFAEAMLGHCNACEKRDVTRMWDWTEATVEPLPTLTGLSPGQKGSTVIPDAPQLPSSVLNIQAAPAMPDPSGLAAALSGITQGGIFRDMSGLAEVTSLLTTLSNNASLDQATRQKAAEAAAKVGAASVGGCSDGGQRKPSARETFDNLTVAKEIAKSAGKMGWSPETTEEVTKDRVGGGGGGGGPLGLAKNIPGWLMGALPAPLAKAAQEAVAKGGVEVLIESLKGTSTSVLKTPDVSFEGFNDGAALNADVPDPNRYVNTPDSGKIDFFLVDIGGTSVLDGIGGRFTIEWDNCALINRTGLQINDKKWAQIIELDYKKNITATEQLTVGKAISKGTIRVELLPGQYPIHKTFSRDEISGNLVPDSREVAPRLKVSIDLEQSALALGGRIGPWSQTFEVRNSAHKGTPFFILSFDGNSIKYRLIP